MRPGNHGGKKESTTMSWADVRQLQEEMTGHLGMRVQACLRTPEDMAAGKLFEVSVEAYDWAEPWGKPKHRVVSYWPHPACATLQGLLVRLWHQLDHAAWHQSRLTD